MMNETWMDTTMLQQLQATGPRRLLVSLSDSLLVILLCFFPPLVSRNWPADVHHISRPPVIMVLWLYGFQVPEDDGLQVERTMG